MAEDHQPDLSIDMHKSLTDSATIEQGIDQAIETENTLAVQSAEAKRLLHQEIRNFMRTELNRLRKVGTGLQHVPQALWLTYYRRLLTLAHGNDQIQKALIDHELKGAPFEREELIAQLPTQIQEVAGNFLTVYEEHKAELENLLTRHPADQLFAEIAGQPSAATVSAQVVTGSIVITPTKPADFATLRYVLCKDSYSTEEIENIGGLATVINIEDQPHNIAITPPPSWYTEHPRHQRKTVARGVIIHETQHVRNRLLLEPIYESPEELAAQGLDHFMQDILQTFQYEFSDEAVAILSNADPFYSREIWESLYNFPEKNRAEFMAMLEQNFTDLDPQTLREAYDHSAQEYHEYAKNVIDLLKRLWSQEEFGDYIATYYDKPTLLYRILELLPPATWPKHIERMLRISEIADEDIVSLSMRYTEARRRAKILVMPEGYSLDLDTYWDDAWSHVLDEVSEQYPQLLQDAELMKKYQTLVDAAEQQTNLAERVNDRLSARIERFETFLENNMENYYIAGIMLLIDRFGTFQDDLERIMGPLYESDSLLAAAIAVFVQELKNRERAI